MEVLQKLNRASLSTPVTHENILDFLTRVPVLGAMKDMRDPSLAEALLSVSRAEYCLSGDVYFTKPMLTSPIAQENYLYVQSLCILAMDQDFYTHRFRDDSYLLLYTLSGKGRMEYEGKSMLLQTGDGIWIDCRKEHHYHTVGDSWTHVALHIGGQSTAAWHNEYSASHSVRFHQRPGGMFYQNIEQLIRDYETLSFGREVRIANDLSNLLTALITDTENNSAAQEGILVTLEHILNYLEQHIDETITLDDLATSSHTSKYYLAHEFRHLTGYSPIDYLIRLRLQRACLLLRTTDLPVNRIAEMVGIPNNHYFGKLFKKKMQLTPGEYRKKAGA